MYFLHVLHFTPLTFNLVFIIKVSNHHQAIKRINGKTNFEDRNYKKRGRKKEEKEG